MAVFYELTTDVFKDRFDRIGPTSPYAARAGAASARRPLRGLEVKEDTFAVLKVIDLLGREIKLYDSSTATGKGSANTNFILQAVHEARAEKFQIVETFGDPYIFFFGEAPRFLECASVLINSQDFNWKAEFWANYDQYLRGSKCAELGARIYMLYDDVIVEGYMLNASASDDAQNPMMVQMQFKLFLTNYRNISMVGDPNFPIRLGVDIDTAQGKPFQTLRSSSDPSQVYDPNSPTWDLPGTNLVNDFGQQATYDPDTNTWSTEPLRSLIIDNVDEWTGQQTLELPGGNDTEVDDLIQEAVKEAAKNAANMNNVDSITDSGLDKANSGQGTGGPAPTQKPNTPVADPASKCMDDLREVIDGESYCTGFDGTKIALGPVAQYVQAGNPPPKVPPGHIEGLPENYNAADTARAVTAAKEAASNNPGTGSFASTTVPEPCDPNRASCS